MSRTQSIVAVGAILVLLGAFSVAAPSLMNDYFVRILIVVSINAMLVVSMGLANGFTGVFSLGHMGFVGVGAYVSGILSLSDAAKNAYLPDLPGWIAAIHLDFLSSTLVAGVICIVLAFLVGAPLMRLSGHFVSVATLGFLIIVNVVLINADAYTRGARTFTGVPLQTTLPWAMGWLLLSLVVLARIVNSPKGRAWRAVRRHDRGAGHRHRRAAHAAFRLRYRLVLRRCRRLALWPLPRLFLALRLLFCLHLLADQHAGDRGDAKHHRRGGGCDHRLASQRTPAQQP